MEILYFIRGYAMAKHSVRFSHVTRCAGVCAKDMQCDSSTTPIISNLRRNSTFSSPNCQKY